jgi:hypothetical protein
MTAPEGMIEAQLLQVRGWVLFGFCPSGQACPGGWGAVRLLSVPSAPTRLLLLLLNRRSPVSGGLGSISLFLPAPPIPTFNFPPSTSQLTVFFFWQKNDLVFVGILHCAAFSFVRFQVQSQPLAAKTTFFVIETFCAEQIRRRGNPRILRAIPLVITKSNCLIPLLAIYIINPI